MNKAQSLFILLSLSLPLSPRCYTQEPATLSLSDAVALSLKRNTEIKASRETVESVRCGVRASYGKFMPQVTVEGKYTRINEPIDIDLNPIRAAMIGVDVATLQAAGVTNPLILAGFRSNLENVLPPFTTRVQKEGFYNLTATLTQPVFAGGKLTANTAAKKEELDVARDNDRATRNKVITDVATGYFRVQFMKDLVQIREEVAEGIAEHQANAQKLLNEGIISKAAKMRADVALAEAKRDHSRALKDLELAEILLKNALGDKDGSYDLTTALHMTDEPGTVESFIEKGLRDNPSLTTLSHRSRQLTQKGKAARAEFLPTIALFGRYEIYDRDLTLLEPEWAAGAVARINVFSGGSDANEIRSVKRQKAALADMAENAAGLVRTGIRKHYIDMESAREQYESLAASRDLAEENLRLNRLSFTEGTASSVDVIDAQLALGKVRTEQFKALFDYAAALVSLTATAGNAEEAIQYLNVSGNGRNYNTGNDAR